MIWRLRRVFLFFKNKFKEILLRREFGWVQWKMPGYLAYKKSFIESKKANRTGDEVVDVVFVIFEKSRGWILDAICKEMAQRLDVKYVFHYSAKDLPKGKRYFFAHYSFYSECLKRNPNLWNAKSTMWHTHPRELPYGEEELLFCMRHIDRIACQNTVNVKNLKAHGVSAKKLKLAYGAADPVFFKTHQRGSGIVGFCSAYYPRKNGKLLLSIVKSMPETQFKLAGKSWDEFSLFADLKAQPNFTYLDLEYKDYPEFYASLDVLVSTSDLEGGPIPVIEAMMSNVVPVVSDTGFGRDLITSGQNGFVFPIGADAQLVCDQIRLAFLLDADIRSTVEHLTWERQAEMCLL